MIVTVINGIVIECESLQQAHMEFEVKIVKKPFANCSKKKKLKKN